ncbi:reverse transcriptase domain-containing protein [Tanacetum coccineum]|uniref:Reverse transcriptase domain-containing protein n=1 Tax=Tanacetum coccineum TaxID=301880 RepID=A0ABQ5FAX9_9ASTR
MVSQQNSFSFLTDIRSEFIQMKMEILLEPTSNKLMVAENPVKEILLKLNLPDHRKLKDGGEVKEFQRSFRHSDTERLSRSDEVLKLRNFKKDATLKVFKSTNQERVPYDQRNNPPQHPRIVYPPILNINYFCHFLDILRNYDPMDDEPMWAADRVVAPTLGSAITIPETANNFAIKELNEGTIETWDELRTAFISLFFPPALFDRLLGEICAFSQHENESLTDAWLRMKEMLRNCHGHNLSKDSIIKIFYHGLNEITQEVLNTAVSGIFLYKTPNQAYQLLKDKVLLKLDWTKNQKTKLSLKKTAAFADEGNSNSDTEKIMTRMDAMTIKMDAQYKELQSRAKQPTPDLDDDDIPMSREEEAKFMQTFSDLGASNNLMPYSLYAKLSLKSLKPTKISIRLADRSFQYPVGIAENMLLEVVGTERMIFNIDSAIKHSYSNDDTCFSIDVIDKILEEDFDALLDEGSKILHSIEGTVLEEEIFSEFDKFRKMTVDENYDSESNTE